jgi:hypothetical protein
MDDELIAKINKLFYGFMKEARRQSFIEFLEFWDLTYEDYEKIKKYFAEQGIKLG